MKKKQYVNITDPVFPIEWNASVHLKNTQRLADHNNVPASF